MKLSETDAKGRQMHGFTVDFRIGRNIRTSSVWAASAKEAEDAVRRQKPYARDVKARGDHK